MSIQGISNLKKAIQEKKTATGKALRVGLFRGGLFLQRESQKIVPVDTGALRASANTRAEGTGMDTEVIVSYATEYAVHVHENLEARHKPGEVAKYLETPVREKRKEIEAVVLKGIEDSL